MFNSGFLYQCKFTERWHCEPFGISFLYRKSLMTGYLTAISAFKPIVKHHSRSVSRADLRGIRSFFMLGLEHRKKQQKAYPGGGPQYVASRPGLTIEHNLLKQSCWGWYEKSNKTLLVPKDIWIDSSFAKLILGRDLSLYRARNSHYGLLLKTKVFGNGWSIAKLTLGRNLIF